jgi:hypothetical protein
MASGNPFNQNIRNIMVHRLALKSVTFMPLRPATRPRLVRVVLANYKRLRELTAKWVAYPSVWLKKSGNRPLGIPENVPLSIYRYNEYNEL